MSAENLKMIPISDFYAGKSIFITGATGFVGKVLVEKLLRECPELQCIYLLLRAKNSKDINERMNILKESQLFDKLRTKQPEFGTKLIPIKGELTSPELGISTEDISLLKENVNIIFHSAATVKFDEPLKISVDLNIIAVRKVLAFSRECRKLEALVHVSTAYSCCENWNIEEFVYDPPLPVNHLMETLSWMPDELVEKITPALLQSKPNTYILTKHLAEHLLMTEGKDLPIAIVRPAIVGAVWKDPIPGWVDSYNGATFVYVATGNGMLRSMIGNVKASAPLVPVDVTCNMLISVGWYTACSAPNSLRVFNCTTSNDNLFTWGKVVDSLNTFYKKTPLSFCIRPPNLGFTRRKLMHKAYSGMCHTLPGYLIDMIYYLLHGKTRMTKLYDRLSRGIREVEYFTSHDWRWSQKNVDTLMSQMSAEDQKIFYFDMRALDWPTYIESWCLGTKKYLLKENMKSLPRAKINLKRLQRIYIVCNAVIILSVWRILAFKSKVAFRTWCFLVRAVKLFINILKSSLCWLPSSSAVMAKVNKFSL